MYYLPGESARASLKQEGSRTSPAQIALSPGRIGPGLIEAPELLARDEEGRISPGRIGPGLIEAGA